MNSTESRKISTEIKSQLLLKHHVEHHLYHHLCINDHFAGAPELAGYLMTCMWSS